MRNRFVLALLALLGAVFVFVFASWEVSEVELDVPEQVVPSDNYRSILELYLTSIDLNRMHAKLLRAEYVAILDEIGDTMTEEEHIQLQAGIEELDGIIVRLDKLEVLVLEWINELDALLPQKIQGSISTLDIRVLIFILGKEVERKYAINRSTSGNPPFYH